jgi:hypothetical protein
MEPAFEYPLKPTAPLVGKWRVSTYFTFIVDGEEKVSCVRYFGDIIEV